MNVEYAVVLSIVIAVSFIVVFFELVRLSPLADAAQPQTESYSILSFAFEKGKMSKMEGATDPPTSVFTSRRPTRSSVELGAD
jgi:hypothetical protein